MVIVNTNKKQKKGKRKERKGEEERAHWSWNLGACCQPWDESGNAEKNKDNRTVHPSRYLRW